MPRTHSPVSPLSLLAVESLCALHLQPASFTVGAGECVCLAGPSGAGKTILLRAIADLIPHRGDARLDDQWCSRMKPTAWRRQVGYLPAESGWWADRVGDHFDNPDREAFAALGFPPDVLDWEIGRLSTGERQRLALLRLLANAPRALLLDEPTASLDPDSVARVEGLLRDYRQRHRAPVLWVSHDREQRARVANRELVLEEGIVREAGP